VILLCSDGSDDAKAAADRAAKLFPNGPMTVLAVWEPYIEMITQNGFGLAYAPPVTDVEHIDAVVEQLARDTAEEGVDRLRHAGIAAQPRTEARGTSIAATILDVADDIDADAIILGTRGRGVSSRCCSAAFRTPSSSTPAAPSSSSRPTPSPTRGPPDATASRRHARLTADARRA
jgi:nucleotide-binding universal stress UspA family protein